MTLDLLIAASTDLSAQARFGSSHDRIVGSLGLGKAGAVRFAEVDGNLLAARAELPVFDGAGKRQASRFQPTLGADGSYILFAGRLEDRADLRVALAAEQPCDDGALYALAYARYGDKCDQRLNGDYAVIQWFPGKQTVRLARSATSTKPLHVWRCGDRIVASSIPRALFAAGLQAKIDPNRLGDALLLNYRDGTSSWFKGASRVACGTSQLHDCSGFSQTVFWSPEQLGKVQFQRDEDYVEAVHEQFVKATRNAMDGIAQPAIALSGGLDSQAVASYLCHHFGPQTPVTTYTSVPQAGWSPPPKPYSFGDESDHVRALAQMYPQISAQFVTGQGHAFGSALDSIHLLGSWPMRNESNMHWIHEVYARAAQDGSQAVVFGAAGNAGFSYDGLTLYADWFLNGRWKRVIRELRKANDPRPLWRKAVSLAVLPNLPVAFRKALNRARGQSADAFGSWCPMRSEFAENSGAIARARAAGHDPEFYDGASARAWRSSVMRDTLSEGAEIELAMQLHHGIGSRDPTLYRPLLELCIGIEDDQYLRDGTDRWLARRLLKGRVPELVRNERRFGRQSPDWSMRFAQDRPKLLQELHAMRDDTLLAQALDLDRLCTDLQYWSGEEDSAGHNKLRINSAVGRAVSTARFIRYIQTRNEA